MNTLEAIAGRRSIRRFKDQAVPRELVERVLEATVLAPSEEKRDEMVRVLRKGIAEVKEDGGDPGSSEWTANVMEQAPVTVFVFNENAPESRHPDDGGNVVDVQSIGGAIQTMLLAAHELGLGTLWICDVFYAYDGLREWLGRKDQMIAAVSIGYADETPEARPRFCMGTRSGSSPCSAPWAMFAAI